MFKRLITIACGGVAGLALLALVSIRAGALFGAGSELDAYLIGVSAPSLFLSLSGTMVMALLTPRFAVLEPESAARRAGEWALLAALLAAGVALVVLFGARIVVTLLAPGLAPEPAALAVDVLRTYVLSIPPTLGSLVFGAYGFARGRVWTHGLASAAFGATWLGLLFVPVFERSGVRVAASCVAASHVQLGVAFLASVRPPPLMPLPRWRLPVHLGAAILGATGVLANTLVGKANLLLDPLVGSLAGAGAVTTLVFAMRFAVLLVAVCGQGPALALLAGRRRGDEPRNAVTHTGLGITMLFAVGCATAIALSFEPTAPLILAHGHFSRASALEVGRLVEAYAPFIALNALAWSLESVYYSLGYIWRLPICNLVGLVLNVCLSLVLLPVVGVVARPIAVTAGAATYLVLLAISLPGFHTGADLRALLPGASMLRVVVAVTGICGVATVCGRVVASNPAVWSLCGMAAAAAVVVWNGRVWLAKQEAADEAPRQAFPTGNRALTEG